ncbi:MAG: hypothetical protein WD941_05930 [Opitutus sp.]
MTAPRQSFDRRVRVVHRHQWLWEPLEDDPTFVLRAMFGTKAVYLGGRLMLCFCAGEDPWCGVLVCTDRPAQPSLMAEFPALKPHPILPKWLYLPETADTFESTAGRLVGLARLRDPRLGVTPGTRKKTRSKIHPGGRIGKGAPRQA